MHAHSYHSTAALGAALARLPVPLVVTPHYHGVGHTRAARLMHVGYRPLGARLLTRAAAVVAVSAAEEALLRNDFPALAATTSVVPNGADTAANSMGHVGTSLNSDQRHTSHIALPYGEHVAAVL